MVAGFLRQCSNFEAVVEHMLRAILPTSCTSVARSTIQRHRLSVHVAFLWRRQRNGTRKSGRGRVVLFTLDKSPQDEQRCGSY